MQNQDRRIDLDLKERVGAAADGVTKDFTKAVIYFNRARKLGYIPAEDNLHDLRMNRPTVDDDL